MKKKLKKIKDIWKKLSIKSKIFLIVALVLVITIPTVLIVNAVIKNDNKDNGNENTTEVLEEDNIEQPLETENVIKDSNTRPYAVMINNHPKARPLQSGLQNAYIIYEMIVEGGLTRYMALFKDVEVERIGSVRSSRHYFLDYALENDAVYVHWGYSPQAQSDISSLKINNINGLVIGDNSKYFTTDRSLGVSIEHTRFTSTAQLQNAMDKYKYRNTTNERTLLNYKNIDIASKEDAKKADKVTIVYSSSVTDKYVYDADKKIYKRYVNDKEHKDYVTKEQYTFKNIITYQVANHSIDSYGRQDLTNQVSGTGYYISEGYAIPINFNKTSRSGKTVYSYMDGTELEINDGNTFIQIQPKDRKLTIE